MANNINQIVDSLISINQVIENFRLQREKTELYDSNRFNPFQFMRTDEMGLSKILAFLLLCCVNHLITVLLLFNSS